MKAITLRSIPEPLARRIEERARRTGRSLNRTVIEMLQEQSNEERPRVYHDLDHLAGIWSDEEANEFDRALKEQRQIDPALWR